MPSEWWFADDVPPIQYKKENKFMRVATGVILVVFLVAGLVIGYSVGSQNAPKNPCVTSTPK